MLLRDSATYLISRLIPGMAGLLGVVLFINAVGEAEYGRFSLIFIVASMGASLAGGWINQAILRFETSHDEDVRGAMRGAIGIAVLAAVVALCAGLVLIGMSPGGQIIFPSASVGTLAWGACLASLMLLYYVRLTLFQAALRPSTVARLEVGRSALFLALPLIGFLTWEASHASLVAGCALSFLFPLLFWPHGRPFAIPTGMFSAQTRALARRMLTYGWPLSVWLAVMLMYPVVDRALIHSLLGIEHAGIYAAVYDIIVRGFALLFAPVLLAAHPRIMHSANLGASGEWRSTLRRALLLQAALFVPALLLTVGFAGPIINTLVKTSGTYPIGTLMLPLGASAFIWQAALLIHKPLEVAQQTRSMMVFLLISLAAHLVLCALLIPHMNLAGAAYSMMLSGALYVALCLFKMSFNHRVSREDLAKS